MKLLIFAHRPEASYFIESQQWQAIADFPFPLMINHAEKQLILITGEGVEKALSSTSATLAKYNITHVTNLGVAGYLQHSTYDLQKDEIYPIRTVYAESANSSLHKKSFQLQTSPTKASHSAQDCLSCAARVLNDKKASHLSNFAPLVDRELWGIAMACEKFQIPLQSYKLISDIAGKQTQCLDIREQAHIYSSALYHYYHNQFSKNKEKHSSFESTQLPSSFHTTRSQQEKLNKLIHNMKLKEKNQNFLNEQINDLSQISLSPKQRTNNLIKRLQDNLNPFTKKLKKHLNKYTSNLDKNRSINIQFDKDFESENFNITIHIESTEHFKQSLENLKDLDIESIQNLLLGNFPDDNGDSRV